MLASIRRAAVVVLVTLGLLAVAGAAAANADTVSTTSTTSIVVTVPTAGSPPVPDFPAGDCVETGSAILQVLAWRAGAPPIVTAGPLLTKILVNGQSVLDWILSVVPNGQCVEWVVYATANTICRQSKMPWYKDPLKVTLSRAVVLIATKGKKFTC